VDLRREDLPAEAAAPVVSIPPLRHPRYDVRRFDINCTVGSAAGVSSRKSGCASEMSALARSATDFPFKLTTPYSVTTYITSERGVVTMFPGVRLSTMRLRRSPRLS